MKLTNVDRVGELFEIAIGYPPDDRPGIVEKHADGNRRLEAEVLRLLELDDQADNERFLEVETSVDEETIRVDERLTPDPCIDSQIGIFRVKALLATGGMGRVYVASRSDGIEQDVAIKILRDCHSDSTSLRMFEREQQALAQLSHPSIASLIDRGLTTNGQPYLVMPLVQGDRIDQFCERTNLSPKEIGELILKVCQAIAHAHQHNVVHCDIKPSNVLVSHNSIPVITDFGLAKVVKSGDLETMTRSVAGTPSFMAPEQLGGKNHSIDARVDVYGIGAMFYTILTGKPPHKGNGFAETLTLVREAEPIPIRKLAPKTPQDLETICHKCLQKKPSNRYSTVSDLAEDIERFLSDKPVLARPIGKLERATRWAGRNTLSAILLFLLGATTITGLVVTTSLWQTAEHRLEVSQKMSLETTQLLNLTLKQAEDFYTELAIELRNLPGSGEFRRQLLEAALEMYQELAEMDSDNPEIKHFVARAHWYLALIHRSMQEIDEHELSMNKALEVFTELASEFPQEHRHQFDMFNCLLQLEDYAEALLVIQPLAELDVEYPTRLYYQDAYAWASLKQARELAEIGDLEQALVLTNQAISITNGLIEKHGESFENSEEDVLIVFRKNIALGLRIQSLVHLSRGQMQLANKKAKIAVDEASIFCSQFPNHAGFLLPILQSAANVAYLSNKRDKAIELTDEVKQVSENHIETNPEDVSFHVWQVAAERQLATMYRLDGDLDSARHHYENVLKLYQKQYARFPESISARVGLASFLVVCPAPELSDHSEALRVIGKGPWKSRRSTRNELLGIIYLRKGDPEKAIEYFSKCTRNSPLTDIYRALALAQTGRRDEAKKVFDDFSLPSIFENYYLITKESFLRLNREFESLVK